MATKPQLFVLLALCLVAAAAARDSIFIQANDKQEIPTASFDLQSGSFQFYNETVEAPRRKALGLGQSSQVSVTFYNSPGMDCTTGNGQCGYGNDVDGNAYGGGGPFVETSLYPYHAASGNFDFLGGCGACGVLTYNSKSRGFVITDTTDHKDDIGGDGYHIDLCLPSFNYFTNGQAGGGNHGGIFTGTWTRVDCSCMGAPDYPDHAMVVRTQAYNQWAKAIVVSRVGGVGEIASVNFRTRNGGFTSGVKVAGWGAWWAPTSGLGGQGGVSLEITMKDGKSHTTGNYPLPDYNLWNTGNVYNVYDNVPSAC